MSTTDSDDLTIGNEHSPIDDIFGNDVFPTYITNENGGGLGDGGGYENRETEQEDLLDNPCRFECHVTDGELIVREGSLTAGSPGKCQQFTTIYPTLGGTPIGPTGENIVSMSISAEQKHVVLWFCTAGDAKILALTADELSSYVDDNCGFLFRIADLELSSVPVITGYSGLTPNYSSQIEAEEVKQLICSDIVITSLPECDEDSDSGDSGDSDDSGSSKDSAIVPVNWTKTGFASLYCVESPDVRFEDTVVVNRPKWKRKWTVRTCGRFKSVVSDGTLEVVSYTADKPSPVGFTINDEGYLECETTYNPFTRPDRIVVRLTGIRRGFLGVRFESRTKMEFEANERRLDLTRYPTI